RSRRPAPRLAVLAGAHPRARRTQESEKDKKMNRGHHHGDPSMQHRTASREEWLAARLALLKEEKELTRRSDEVARRRQELPWVRIDKEYRFETDEGMERMGLSDIEDKTTRVGASKRGGERVSKASLADLFRGRSQLLVYHSMFGPDYTAGCPSCSAIGDGFN